MPQLALTDLSIKNLKSDNRVDFWDTKFPSFGIRVGPRSKTFILKVGNSRRTLGTYPAMSLQEARKQAHIGKTVPASSSISPMFAEAYLLFKSVHVATKKRSTQDNYQGMIERHFLKRFEKKRLDDISYRDLISITDKLTKSNQAYALAVIRIFWNFCRRRQLTKNNPVDTVQVRPSKPRERVLSADELRLIWHACDVSSDTSPEGDATLEPTSSQPLNPTFAAIVKLLMLTGQRKSEITNLHVSWIREGQITLPRELTKNGRQHTFPIGALSTTIIDEIRDQEPPVNGLVFSARPPASGVFNGFSKCKRSLDKKLGPYFKHWTLHDLRRTFASNLAALGVRIEVTEKLLNHVSGTMSGIVGVYQRYDFKDEMKAAVELWESKLTAIIATVPDVQTST